MGFRQAKSTSHENRQAWADWISVYRSELQAIGLPPEIYLSAEHWADFLENGYLEWHPQDRTDFSFDHLSPALAGALRRFLEQQYGDADRCPPLLGWLRVRHLQSRID